LDLYPSVSTGVFDDFIGHIFLVVLDGGFVKSTTDQSLSCEDSIFGVGDGLPLGSSADKFFSVFGDGDN
jgi:NAD-specific glutamate dehydrogenase